MKHHHHHIHILRKMEERGWTHKELHHAKRQFLKSYRAKNRWTILNKVLAWVVMGFITITNIAVMAFIAPLLLVIPNAGLYGILMILGALFGLLFTIILSDIDHMFRGHHHYFLYVLMPYLSIVGGYLVIQFAMNKWETLMLITRNPWMLGVVYMVSFLIPVILLRFLKR